MNWTPFQRAAIAFVVVVCAVSIAVAAWAVAIWGFSRAEIQAELAAVDPSARPQRGAALTRYTLERKLLVQLRRNIHHNALGRWVRRVRRVCDVLLR